MWRRGPTRLGATLVRQSRLQVCEWARVTGAARHAEKKWSGVTVTWGPRPRRHIAGKMGTPCPHFPVEWGPPRENGDPYIRGAVCIGRRSL